MGPATGINSSVGTPNSVFSAMPSGAATPLTPPLTASHKVPGGARRTDDTQRVIEQTTELVSRLQIERSSEEEKEDVKGVVSPLDLPGLYQRPSAERLLEILHRFTRVSGPTNFSKPTSLSEESDGDSSGGHISAAPGTGFFDWLTKVVASPLQWIDDDDTREQIWDLASTLMAERCGRTAAPTITRRIQIEGMREVLVKTGQVAEADADADCIDIKLVEPSLTEDLLGLKTWGSSFVLASRLVREHLQLISHGTGSEQALRFENPVLELGTGTGLVGIVASRLGYDVTATDLAEIMDNLRANVAQNTLPPRHQAPPSGGGSIVAETLDWTDPDGAGFLARHGAHSFPTLLVSDPIYSPQHPIWIRDMVVLFLEKSPRAHLCLQLPLRPKFEDIRETLYVLLREAGLARARYEEEDGYDDFGQSRFAWSLWRWK